MQVFVTSNCIILQLVRALQLLMPGSSFAYVGHASLVTPSEIEPIKRQMSEADLVISLDWDEFYGDFSAKRIGQWTKRHIIIPGVSFAGYHPDITYIKLSSGGSLSSPMADYNSVITAAGYLAGFPAERTVDVFNSLTYSRLGYFDAFAASKADLVAKFASHGLDISQDIENWERRGRFMHSVNHPASFVVGDIATRVCLTNGLGTCLETSYGDYLGDELVHGPVWPVFPEIARRLGVQGSYVFKTSASSARGPERVLTLEDFVAQSYEMYRETDAATWVLPARVQSAVEHLKKFHS